LRPMGKMTFFRFVLPGICLGWLSVCGGAQVRAAGAGQPVLLVVNQGDASVSVVDPVAARQIATVAEGVTGVHGHEAVVSPDGRTAYVPVYGSTGVGKPGIDGHEMLVVDVAGRKVVGHVDFGHGVRPHCAVYDAGRGLLYVTTELDQTVSIIDPRTLKIVGTVPTGQAQSHMLALSRDGKRGYTANVGPGTVSVLDMVGRKTVAVIPISGMTQRIALSNDDKMVFTSDQTEPRLAVIDTATNKVKTWVALPGTGYGTAATRDGRWLLVAIPAAGQVAVVDLGTLKVVRTIAVPSAPQEILVRPDGKVAYVSCNKSGKVAAIDLAEWKVQSLIDAGSGADGLAWAR
jgi:DNA-binding beta-propeller fold protein YncE